MFNSLWYLAVVPGSPADLVEDFTLNFTVAIVTAFVFWTVSANAKGSPLFSAERQSAIAAQLEGCCRIDLSQPC